MASDPAQLTGSRVSRTDLPTAEASTAWRGLRLAVRTNEKPQLRVELAPPQHLRIVQGSDTLLWAAIAARLRGVTWCRSGSWQPVIAPIAAQEARQRACLEGAAWWQSWSHWFVEHLEHSQSGPLSTGSWAIRPAAVSGADGQPRIAPSGVALDYVDHEPDVLSCVGTGGIDWFRSDEGLLPLIDLPTPDDGRVKAYRKRLREGEVTPVLTWWVSALACHVVLDGHFRLAAAMAEGVSPPLLTLTALRDPSHVTAGEVGQDWYEERRDHIYRTRGPGSRQAGAIERQVAAAQLRRQEQATTWGWPLPGGVPGWEQEVALRAPHWRGGKPGP